MFILFTISSSKQICCYGQFLVTKLILVLFLSGDVFISKRTGIPRRPRWSCTHAATRSKSMRIQQNVLIPGTLLYLILLAVVCTVNRVVINVVWVLASTFSCQEYINFRWKWISTTGFSCIKANVQQRKKLISARHRKVCLRFALKKKIIKKRTQWQLGWIGLAIISARTITLHWLYCVSLLLSLLSFFVIHSWSFLIGRDICLKCVRHSTSSKWWWEWSWPV